MLNSFWNWFVIIIVLVSIFGCWWLLQWTKGVSDRSGDEVGSTGHVWDEDLTELNTPLPRWWLYLFNITIVFALAYLVLYPGLGNFGGVKGWTQEKQYQEEMQAAEAAQQAIYARFKDMDAAALEADPEAMEIGGRLFRQNCAMCHGSDGRGAMGFPNLADNDWIWGDSYDQVLTTITNGRMAAMPPWGPVLGDEGVREVVAYVRQLSGQEADPALAQAGQARFQTLCVACHGIDGKGNPALGAPNLTDNTWLYGGDAATIETTIRNGRNGQMPMFKGKLSEERRKILAAYVLSLSDS
ncbi:MAG: cytochrome-c oxidase, cbb3-type subunit III [Lysobacterales bacterium]|jgi:cytochrome c oxidase cbb3-type subunit 3